MRSLPQFFLATALTSLAPLACLSVTARLHGADAFLALALGQAVGGVIAIVATWGWDVTGPQRIAAMSEAAAASELLRSVRTRGAVLATIALPGAAVAWYLSSGTHAWLAALSTLAVGSLALNPSWWCSGRQTPDVLLRVESFPRAAAAAAAALLIGVGVAPVAYPILTLAVMAPAYLTFYRRQATRADSSTRQPIVAELRSDAGGPGIATLGAMYTTALLPLVQLLAPAAALGFATGQRLLNYANLATITFANAFMGSRTSAARRRGIVWMILASSVLAAGLCVAAPFLSRFLFDIALTSWVTPVLVSATYLGVAVNTAISKLWLIPRGRQRQVLWAVAAAAVVGPPLTVVLARLYGADGGLGGMLVAEALFTCVCLLPRSGGTSRAD